VFPLPTEVWQPTDWDAVDAIIEFELLWLISQGYLRPRPADDDPTGYVWDYPYDEQGNPTPPFVETAGPFLDEVFDLYHAGYIRFEHGNVPRLLPAGEEYLATLVANPPPSYRSAQTAGELPEYIREEAQRAIRMLSHFGGIDEASADHPRLAAALLRMVSDRWPQEKISQETMLAAVPTLIFDALKTEEA
jgi:hypothetical protein